MATASSGSEQSSGADSQSKARGPILIYDVDSSILFNTKLKQEELSKAGTDIAKKIEIFKNKHLLVWPSSMQNYESLLKTDLCFSGKKRIVIGDVPSPDLTIIIKGLNTEHAREESNHLRSNYNLELVHGKTENPSSKLPGSFALARCRDTKHKQALIKNGLNIGNEHFRVQHFIKMPVICFQCSGFNHVAKYCSKPAKCLNCSGGHVRKDCPAGKKMCCPNCKGNHSATSKDCPILKEIRDSSWENGLNWPDLSTPPTQSKPNISQQQRVASPKGWLTASAQTKPPQYSTDSATIQKTFELIESMNKKLDNTIEHHREKLDSHDHQLEQVESKMEELRTSTTQQLASLQNNLELLETSIKQNLAFSPEQVHTSSIS